VGSVTIGIDIGQKHDPTAIAVMEQEERLVEGRYEDHYLGRHIERLPLSTSYTAIATRLAGIVGNVAKRGASVAAVFVDATGVGKPVVDVLNDAGVQVTAVYFTHGDRRTVNEDRSVTLGKAYLVSHLKVLMQTHRIHLTHSAEMEAMQTELLDYEIRVNEHANDTYGAFTVGTHDDLVTALGLAVQEGAGLPFAWLRNDPAFRAGALGTSGVTTERAEQPKETYEAEVARRVRAWTEAHW
jgi:hypothetical protein